MKQLITITILFLTLIACEAPGTDILYSEAFLEVDAATTVTGEQSFSYEKKEDGQSTPSGFIVTLAAAQQPSPVNFNFEVDASSTAIKDTHYQLTGNLATIAANSSTVTLPIEILDDNITIGESWTIVVSISSSDVPVNPNYQTGTHIVEVF